MEVTQAGLLYFGNDFPSADATELLRKLHQHSRDRRFRLLGAFLDEAILVLQDEVARLPHHVKSQVPHFDNVVAVAENGFLRDLGLGAAMESVLLLVSQLGLFIGHHEAQDKELGLCNDTTTILAGLGVGLFTAAAVALSSSLAQAVKNGAECLRVSFRLGVHVGDFSTKLEAPQPEGVPQSWAHVVTGMTEQVVQEQVDRVNGELGNPEIAKVFVSAADKTSVSISGPPSRIKAAFQHSSHLRYSKSLALPVYDGLCHAKHLYGRRDIEAVIDGERALIPSCRKVLLPLVSPNTGRPSVAGTAGELLAEIATELITGTIYLDRIIDGITAHVQAVEGVRTLQIDTLRTSIIFEGLLDTLTKSLPGVSVVKDDMVDWVHEDFGTRRPSTVGVAKLAIVGMACRMPGGGNDPEQFWDLLQQGRDVHTKVPLDRFDLETHYDPSGNTENAATTPYGNFIDRPGFFDAGFFTMSPREAEQTDPMQRLAITTAYEAMEMAGLVPGRTASSRRERIGTFYGQASDDWRELNAAQNIGTYAVPGGVRGFTTGRINYFFKFAGPSFCVDTACSSSMAAVHQACMALWLGEADTAIAGGVNIITDPDNYAGLGNAHFLSKTGQCKVWDKDADGYCRAEGIGSVVIKRLEDAEADNDNILAVILSGATNHCADAISITHPHAGHQKDNYRRVLQRAGVNPLDVSFVEMHGTGTQAGDAIESESVLDVFAPVKPRRRADQKLLLGAVKSNIGHGEAAAGISSLIKVLLSFQKSAIPPHVGIKTEINPTIPKDLDRRNASLAMEMTPWPRPRGKKRIAMVNSFGAHGGNTTLLLEDPPERIRPRASPECADTRALHPIIISARSKKSLQANLQTMLAYVEASPDVDLGDLSYTTCARRMQHSLRIATTASTVSGLATFLRTAIDNKAGSEAKPISPDPPSVVLTFTGQGASYKGIRQDLFDEMPYFREQVLQLDQLVQRLGFPSVVPAITGGDDDDVLSPVISQLSIVVLEMSLARFWSYMGVKPSAVIGHSLGEYAALAVAGVLSAADVLYLVGTRARITEQRCTPYSHGMLSVLGTSEEIGRILKESAETEAIRYEISCQNTHSDTVLGATKTDMDAIRKVLEAKGLKAVPLEIPFAYHTSQMEAVIDELEALAQSVPFKAPSIPVLSTMLGTAVFDGKTINANYLGRQTRNCVKFAAAAEAAYELGLVDDDTIWIDVGPHPVCVGFVKKLFPQARIGSSCRRNEDNISTVAKSLITLHLAGLTPNWNEYYRANEKAYRLLNLPKYSWNETDYWIPYYGTWTLDKAHLKYGGGGGGKKQDNVLGACSSGGLRTSTIHQITNEMVEKDAASLSVLSDLQHPEFRDAVYGHTMNGCGVATSSIWTDMAMAVGEYLYKKLRPSTKEVHMNVCELEVLHAQVASKIKGARQHLALEAKLDWNTQHMSLAWYDVGAETGERAPEHFASAAVRFEDAASWASEWKRTTHLVLGRIEALRQLANENKANRIGKRMAYTLFKNVVDYADQYRGIDSMILNEYEAVADVTLAKDRHGTWHTPPHWIDSVCHLAGLIMNGSDASDTQDYFYVTPGSDSLRFLKPLEAGGRYKSYVRMFPLPVEAGNMHAGDVYILQDDSIVGMLSQIRFRRVPRLLMDRFFSADTPSNHGHGQGHDAQQVSMGNNDNNNKKKKKTRAPVAAPRTTAASTARNPPAPAAPKPVAAVESRAPPRPQAAHQAPSHNEELSSASSSGGGDTHAGGVDTPPETQEADTSIVGQCIRIIARETNLDMDELTPDATFAQLGVDSLMSLVLSDKFRNELGIEVKSSLFLECPTVGEVRQWIDQNC